MMLSGCWCEIGGSSFRRRQSLILFCCRRIYAEPCEECQWCLVRSLVRVVIFLIQRRALTAIALLSGLLRVMGCDDSMGVSCSQIK